MTATTQRTLPHPMFFITGGKCKSCCAPIAEGIRCPACKTKQRDAARKYRESLEYKKHLKEYLKAETTLAKRKFYMRTYRRKKKLHKRCVMCTERCMRSSVYCRKHRDHANARQAVTRSKNIEHYRQLYKEQRKRAKARRAAYTVPYEMILRSFADIEMSRWSTIVTTSSSSKNCSASTIF